MEDPASIQNIMGDFLKEIQKLETEAKHRLVQLLRQPMGRVGHRLIEKLSDQPMDKDARDAFDIILNGMETGKYINTVEQIYELFKQVMNPGFWHSEPDALLRKLNLGFWWNVEYSHMRVTVC